MPELVLYGIRLLAPGTPGNSPRPMRVEKPDYQGSLVESEDSRTGITWGGLNHSIKGQSDHRRISSGIIDMAQYFLPINLIVLDQDLLPFSPQIITGLPSLYQFSYGPGHHIRL